MEASRRRPRGQSFVCAFAIAALLALGSNANAACQVDVDCANTPNCANDQPDQKDLTQFCVQNPVPTVSEDVAWNWDDTAISGNNTEDGCALYDTDGDGAVNYAVCVTVGGDPLDEVATTVYSCSDKKPDRCTAPNAALPSFTTTCSVTNPSPDDPYPSGASSPNDTKASCTVRFADFGVLAPDLLNVCSFPSGSPNSDPEDCILIPVPPNLCDTTDCNDGLFCNGVETCDPDLNGGAGGCVSGTPPTCSNGQFCDGTETCDPTASGGAGACVPGTPPTCDNGQFCDGTETCDPTASGGAGACVPGTAPTCDNGQFCDGTEVCDPTASGGAGACVPGTAPTCDNGQFCDGTEVCDPTASGGAGACVNGTAPTCSNGQFCDGVETCDPTANSGAGGCVNGTPPNCADTVACTDDDCDETQDKCTHTANDGNCSDDQDVCTVARCVPTDPNPDPDGCIQVFTPAADPSCSTGVCRTAGFWATHGGSEKKGINTTLDVIDNVGCLNVCGERISNTDLNNDDSAIEALCVSPQGTQLLQLARQLTATALNCIVTNGTTDCTNIDIADLSLHDVFGACDSACASGQTSADIDPGIGTTTVNCIQILDCFNNGGIYDVSTGSCTTGSCSDTGTECGPTAPCPTGRCVVTPGNCHDQPLVNGVDGKTIPTGNASSSSKCNAANGNNCTFVDGDDVCTGKKDFGEACCGSSQFPDETEVCTEQ
jgi:hypothetical protein